MGCGPSKSTNAVAPAIKTSQSGKSKEIDGRSNNVGQEDVDRKLEKKALNKVQGTTDSAGQERVQAAVVERRTSDNQLPALKNVLPLRKPVESSSESYLDDSDSCDEGRKTHKMVCKESNNMHVEETNRVFVTQAGSLIKDTCLGQPSLTEDESTRKKIGPLPMNIQLEDQKAIPGNGDKKRDEPIAKVMHLEDSKAIQSEIDDKKIEKPHLEFIHLEDSKGISNGEIKETPRGGATPTSQHVTSQPPGSLKQQLATDNEEIENQGGDELPDVEPSFSADDNKVTSKGNVTGLPSEGASPTLRHVTPQIPDSSSVDKDLVGNKSSSLSNTNTEGEHVQRFVVEEDMVCESINDACLDALNVGTDKPSVTMPTEKPTVAVATKSDRSDEVVTIRIEVDDEFESEFKTKHSVEKVKEEVAIDRHGNQSRSSATCELGSKSTVLQIQVDAKTRSSSLLAPDTMETSASGRSLNDISSSIGSVGRTPSWNADRQSKMEKLMNEELDVHPSLRSVSPALGFVRSMVAACLDEVEEEGEEEGEKVAAEVEKKADVTAENEAEVKVKEEVKAETEVKVEAEAETETEAKINKVANQSNKVNDQDSGDNVTEKVNEDAEKETITNSDFPGGEQTLQHAKITKNDEIENQEIVDKNLLKTDVVKATEPSADLEIDNHVNKDRPVAECTINHVTGIEHFKGSGKTTGHIECHVIEREENHPDASAREGNHVTGSSQVTGSVHVTGSNNNQAPEMTNHHLPIDKENLMKVNLADRDSTAKSDNVVTNSNTHVTTEDSPSIPNKVDQRIDQPDLDSQRKLATALRFACKALPWQHIRDQASPGVTSLNLSRTLTWRDYSAGDLVQSLRNLKELDVSNNVLGPQGFRVMCLAVAYNSSLTSLNLANNLSDTESSKALGIMLSKNSHLEFLDVSGNDLGKDYFSRCVGPALQSNKSLKTLKCASCGSNDMAAILRALSGNHGNRTLVELDVSNNQLGEKFGKCLEEALKIPDCSLKYVDVHVTDLDTEGMVALLSGVQNNKSLVKLNAGGHKVRSLSFLMDLIYCCVVHPTLQNLSLDNSKPTEMNEWDTKSIAASPKPSVSCLTSLSLAGCCLNDTLMASLAVETKGLLSRLAVLNVSGNTDITGDSVTSICTMITRDNAERPNVLESLEFALNNGEAIPDVLSSTPSLSNLRHLSLRKSKVSPAKLTELRKYLVKNSTGNGVMITSLNLDAIKLSGTSVLQGMLGLSDDFAPIMPCALTSLSLSSCSLSDKDVKPLLVGVAKGLGLVHVTLSSNRLTDTSIDWLVDSLVDLCSLRHLDLSNNKVRASGAEKLASAIENGKMTQLSTLLLSNNNIGPSGILALISQVNPHSTLHGLNLKDQQQPVGEEDMDKILKTLAEACDIPLNSNSLNASTTYLEFSPQTSINLTGLGGEPGDYGPLLDSVALQTDYSRKHKRTLNLQDVLGLFAVLANSGNVSEPALSKEDWDLVISADKDAPAWLQVPSHRARALYVSNLPLTATREKLDSLLEDDADCNVKEIFLLKDPILRKPNGLAWALFNDEESVQKAMKYYDSGQAQCFGRPFVTSPIIVNIKGSEYGKEITEDEARQEMALRHEMRKADETEKAAIIQAKFAESTARHEYAAQHPAYADGRIW